MTGTTPARRRFVHWVLATALCASVQAGVCAAEDSPGDKTRDPYRCCGLNCLDVIAHMHEHDPSLATLQELLSPRENGDCSVADLERASKAVGLKPLSARVDWATLPSVSCPCIVQLRSATRYGTGSHYVILMGLHRTGVILLDPPGAGTLHPYSEFKKDWTGVVVAFPLDERERREYVAALSGSFPWVAWMASGLMVAVAGILVLRRRHRVSAAPAAFLLLTITANLLFAGCARTPTPSILYLESPTLDLGVLDPGEHPFSIAIENRGGSGLAIERISSSCSCTVAKSPPMVLPGAKAAIQGTVKVSPGPGAARLSIADNDPGKERLVQLSWFGRSPPRLLPPSLEISQRLGETATREFEISYAGGDSSTALKFLGGFKLPKGMSIEIMSDDPYAIRAIPGLGVGNNAPAPVVGKAVFRLSSSVAQEQSLFATCIVKVSHRGVEYQLPLSITLSTHGALQAKPEQLLFTANSLDRLKRIERKATIRSDTAIGCRLEVVRKPPFVEVSLAPAGSDSQAALTVRVIAAPPAGVKQDEIVLTSAAGAELVIPVFIDYDP